MGGTGDVLVTPPGDLPTVSPTATKSPVSETEFSELSVPLPDGVTRAPTLPPTPAPTRLDYVTRTPTRAPFDPASSSDVALIAAGTGRFNRVTREPEVAEAAESVIRHEHDGADGTDPWKESFAVLQALLEQQQAREDREDEENAQDAADAGDG